MRETWYVLEDGNLADPNDVAPGDDGLLRHSNGVAVEMRGQVPHTRGVDDADAERAKTSPKPDSGKKDVKPAPQKPGYKTRESKAN